MKHANYRLHFWSFSQINVSEVQATFVWNISTSVTSKSSPTNVSARTHTALNWTVIRKMSCRSYASTHEGDSSFRGYLSQLVSIHEWVGVFKHVNKWLFLECQSQVLSFSRRHKCGCLITFGWSTGLDSCCQCVRIVVALLLRCRYFWCGHLSTDVWNNIRHS